MNTMQSFPYLIQPKEPFLESRPWNGQTNVILGIPFDENACFRKGACKGPEFIRKFSQNLESFSPYCQKDLLDLEFCDLGDFDIKSKNTDEIFDSIRKSLTQLISNGHKPIIFGGDHSISVPIVQSFVPLYPDLVIIQFDAHADLREEFEGNKRSNACTMGNILKILQYPEQSIYQFGIRSFDKSEFEKAKKLQSLYPLSCQGLEKLYKQIKDRPVILTFDLDIFDPGFLPGTGTPEAGGISFNEFIQLLPFLAKFNLKGADLVELGPKS